MGEVAATTVSVSQLEIEGVLFPPSLTPPASSKSHFLAGAGVRGLEIGGKFIAFTAIGVYLEEDAVSALGDKWKGKGEEELAASLDFFHHLSSGPFEKFTKVIMLLPLTGEQYTEKVSENCVAYWKAIGIYTEAEADAIEKFKAAFKSQTFPPGASILFTHSSTGSLTIAFSKDGSIPQVEAAVIENKALTVAILESIIGEHGVSPAAKRSLALRLSTILNKVEDVTEKAQVEEAVAA